MSLLFVGWEGVGLCSYLLIGFYYLKKSATDAGNKAFIVNRIGDFGFMLGYVPAVPHIPHVGFQRACSRRLGRCRRKPWGNSGR